VRRLDKREKNMRETIDRAIEIKKLNNLPFVTIWKTEELFGFNFDKQEIGYKTKEYDVEREVIGVY
jgi:hypothetical protein